MQVKSKIYEKQILGRGSYKQNLRASAALTINKTGFINTYYTKEN
jgi:hypothetical protein